MVLETLDASLLVDGHKNVLKAASVVSMLGANRDVRIVHLIRDPRAFLSSCRKYDWSQDTDEIVNIWRDTHLEIEASFGKTVQGVRLLSVRYEDLATNPEEVMKRVFQFLGFEPPPFDPSAINPMTLHLHGNNMLERWDGTIRLDTSWQDRLSQKDRQRVLDLASDVCKYFGYSDR